MLALLLPLAWLSFVVAGRLTNGKFSSHKNENVIDMAVQLSLKDFFVVWLKKKS